jgi:hypothetical protein
MERPAPDPAKLLEAWMQWEQGEALPGRTMSTFKTGGLRDILEGLVAAQPAVIGEVAESPVEAETWTPVV